MITVSVGPRHIVSSFSFPASPVLMFHIFFSLFCFIASLDFLEFPYLDELLFFVTFDLLVSEAELKRLHRRFKKLDADGSGTLTIDEFMSIPELAGTLIQLASFLLVSHLFLSKPSARARRPNFR
jgi:hypothetical protein